MDILAIVLGACALAAAGLAVRYYVLLSQARATAASAAESASAGAARLTNEIAQLRTDAQAREGELKTELTRAAERVERLSIERAELEGQLNTVEARHQGELVRLRELAESERQRLADQERQLRLRFDELNTRFETTFKSLAADALARSGEEFLKLADERFKAQQQQAGTDLDGRKRAVEELVTPLKETLARTESKLAEIEKTRLESFSTLSEQVRALGEAGTQLRGETARLVRALREPHVRGRYGEIQLKRVAELAGMTAYCDFMTQDQSVDGEGNALRPDMVVKLPGERQIVIDAKTNIRAYLEALEATTPEAAEECLERYARHVSEQATALGRKKYWSQYEGSPEFVIMFVPGDGFIDAALSRRPELLEHAARQNVLLASPSTLIALLRAVAVAYKEQRLASEAEELRRLGKEFHERFVAVLMHLSRLGETLGKSVEHYNSLLGSYQTRLEPTLRKFEDSGATSGKAPPELPPVSVVPRGPVGKARQSGQEVIGALLPADDKSL